MSPWLRGYSWMNKLQLRDSRRIKKLQLTKHTGSTRATHPTVQGSNWTAGKWNQTMVLLHRMGSPKINITVNFLLRGSAKTQILKLSPVIGCCDKVCLFPPKLQSKY